MTATDGDPLWFHEERAYAVVVGESATAAPERSGLSHAEAMMLAERLEREGKTARVMHVIGDKSYEVDRYPIR